MFLCLRDERGNADAGCDAGFHVFDGRHGRAQPFGRDQAFRFAQPERSHDKFLAAMSRYDVVIPGCGLEGGCDGLQDAIAFGMAETVVDLFEMIQIDHQQRCIFLPAVSGFEHLFGIFVKCAPVIQAGQAVMIGEQLQFRMQSPELGGLSCERILGGLALGDVAYDTEDQLVAMKHHRTQHDVDRKLAAVLVQGEKLGVAAHRSGVCVGDIAAAMAGMEGSEAGRDQHFDRLVDQLASVVAEQGFRLRVRQNDAPGPVDDEQGIRCVFKDVLVDFHRRDETRYSVRRGEGQGGCDTRPISARAGVSTLAT